MQNRIVLGEGYDPWHNLALEDLLFQQQAGRQGATLFLWQNQNTVVIGKNQNAWQECRVSLLEEEGGKLARRSSGGGAVFHDLGNLNFTFLTSRDTYNLNRQLEVVRKAVAGFGVEAVFTGRNDLVVAKSGAKFSGNAFRFSQQVGMHHGTVLLQADMDRLGRYLAPSPDKLNAKGVKSVRSRVCNLCDYNSAITVEGMGKALCNAFVAAYGPGTLEQAGAFAGPALSALQETYASWDWRLGKTPAFDLAMERRFDWGGVSLHLELEKGQIKAAQVYSDAMDAAFIERIAPALTGCPFSSRAMAARLAALAKPEAAQLADWILEKDI